MAQTFTFTVTVEVQRTTGKFAARDDIAEAIANEIEGAHPGGIYSIGNDGNTDYEIESWEVEW